MKYSVFTYIIATMISQAAGELFVTPRDTESKVGDTTYFNCSTNLASREIFWHHDDKYIYTGIGIHEPYHERFEIDRNATEGSHNLVIHSVQPEDAGQYFCIDDDGIGTKRSAQLVVLVKDPACQSNIRLDEVIGPNVFGILPDEVQLTCNVTYHGIIPPRMEWKKFGQTNSIRDGVASHVVIDNRVVYTLRLKGGASLDNSSYACQTTRATQNQYKCSSETIKVFYFLGGNETLQSVVIGDKITCVAYNSTMPCSSQWYHDNYTCPLSCDETITTHLLGIYMCTVKCNVRGNDYFHEAQKVSVVEATKPPPLIQSESSQSKIIIIALVVTLVVTVAAASVFTVILYKRYNLHYDRECLESTWEGRIPLAYMTGNARRCNSEALLTSKSAMPLAETTADSRPIHIIDLTVLNKEVYILLFERQDIEVYDSMKFQFKRQVEVDVMMDPRSIASCPVNNCLYAVEWSQQKLLNAIFRIDPSNGNIIKAWKITGALSKLSVASDTNVMCPMNNAELYEYTADGELIRMIHLGRNPVDMTPRINAMHAVKLDNGLLVVCQSDPGEVYLISTKATSSSFGRIDEVEILKKFSEESGYLNDSSPVHLSVGKEGSILVTDRCYGRVVLMNSNFDEAQILISEEDGMESPWKTCFNKSTCEWIVTDRYRIFVYQVEGETIERQIHYLSGYEDNQDEILDDERCADQDAC